MAIAGIGVDEHWSEPDGLVKYFWEFIGKRLEHMPRRSFHPRITQTEEEASDDVDLAFRALKEKLGDNSDTFHLISEVEAAMNHASATKMDMVYIQGLQDGILLAEKMRSGLVAWLADAWPYPLKNERQQDTAGEGASA